MSYNNPIKIEVPDGTTPPPPQPPRGEPSATKPAAEDASDILAAIDNSIAALNNIASEVQYLKNATQNCCAGGGGGGAKNLVLQDNSTLTQAQIDAKCLRANFVFETLYNFIEIAKNHNIDAYAGVGVAAILDLGAALAAVYALTSPWSEIFTAAVGAAAVLVFISFDLEQLYDDLTDNHQQIVEGLYKARTGADMDRAFAKYVTQHPNMLFLQAIMTPNKILFLANQIPMEYTPQNPVDCSGGGVECEPALQSIWYAGTPNLLIGDDLQSGAVSGTGSPSYVKFETRYQYDITIESVGGSNQLWGASLYTRACDMWVQYGGSSYINLPLTIRCYGININTNQTVEFTAQKVV